MAQTKQVHDYMARRGSITAAEAVRDLGCYRLAARIKDLEAAGVSVHREREARIGPNGKETAHWTRYSLGGGTGA